MPWKVDWAVTVDGRDRTNVMRGYLIQIDVTDKEGVSSDACNLTFDDTDGQLELPRQGAALRVYLDGVNIFTGVVDKVRSSGTRGGGRLLAVGAKSYDTRGKAKELQAFHKDDATLEEFLSEAADSAGYSIEVDPAIATVKRDYWSADHESFMDIAERVAREVNGTFKLRGNKAVLVRRGDTDITPVDGVVGQGGNVIRWDIAPFTGRGKFKKARARWFDRKSAAYKSTEVDIENDDEDAPDTTNIVRINVGDGDQAKHRTNGRKSEAERDGGDGSVELDLAPEAQAEAVFKLTGARPGIDGSYRIVSVTHKASRTGGATTTLELKLPGSGARKTTPATPDDAGDFEDPDIVRSSD